MAKIFVVENDFLSDDWGIFHSLEEAQAFVREKCREIAEANVDANGMGNCPAFQGMTLEQIVEHLYAEHVETIEERDGQNYPAVLVAE